VKRIVTILIFLAGAYSATLGHSFSDEQFYRDLAFRIRQKGSFKIPMPSNGDLSFSYEMAFANPRWDKPIMNDFFLDSDKKKFYRHFWDKIFLQDGAFLSVGGEKVPLTCVFLSGQDNRFSKDTPLIPDFVLKVYLVANDFTCTGPINPGWPSNGGKKETWDTYVYYEIRDPTIMLPTEAKIRYRWVEFPAIVIDQGGEQ
jgi:hypothetical protein